MKYKHRFETTYMEALTEPTSIPMNILSTKKETTREADNHSKVYINVKHIHSEVIQEGN